MVSTNRGHDSVYLDWHNTERAVRRSLRLTPGDLLPPQQFIAFLQDNSVPLLSMAQPHDESGAAGALCTSVAWQAALSRERTIYAGAHAEYVALASAWQSEGIECICFKSAGIAPSFPYSSSNVDILVRSADVPAARACLLRLGYIELRNAEEPQKWLFRRFQGGRSVSAVHLHSRVGWEEGFMLEAELWQRAHPSVDDLWTMVPGPEDVIAINLAHGLIENKALDLSDLQKIRHALRSGPLDWAYMDRVASERGWLPCLHAGLLLATKLERDLYGDTSIPPERLETCERTLYSMPWLDRFWRETRGREAQLPFTISFLISKRLFFSKIWADSHRTLASRPTSTALSLARGFKQKSRIRPQNPMLFAISGVDGSGKSVQIEALSQSFSACAIRATRVWTRFGSTDGLHQLHRVRHLLRTRRGGGMADLGKNGSEGYGPYVRTGPALLIWITLATVDYLIRLQYVRWRLAGGEVVLADRYVTDAAVELQQRLPQHARLAAFLAAALRAVAPAPAAAYLIEVDAETAARRTPAIPGEPDRADSCARYAALAERSGLVRIDGELPFEAAAGELVHHALTTYMAAFRPIGNVIFFENDWQLNPQMPWFARFAALLTRDERRSSRSGNNPRQD